jgi:CRISPR system Cascade subunit CasA
VTTPSFNLVDSPWIPVIHDGTRTRVSLQGLAERPDAFEALDLADALGAVALFRQVVLPVWLDALGLPADAHEWRRRWADPRAGATRVLDYLQEHRGRFDLFDAEAPFAQVAGLRTAKDETKPVSLLQPDQPTGNNVPLFCARTEADPPSLSPADAVVTLLVAHCFDTAAIKSGAVGDPAVKAGKTTGNPTGSVGQLGVLVPLGASVAQTLALNTPLSDRLPVGTPHWRRQPLGPTWTTRPAEGLLDLLTWQSRRVRLLPDVDEEEVIVRRVVLTAGDRLSVVPTYEPHTGWKQEAKPAADTPPQRPARHVPGRAAWRGMGALLATRDPRDNRIKASRRATQLITRVLLATRDPRDNRISSLLLRQLADLRVDEVVPPDLRLDVLAVQVQYGNQSAVVEDASMDLLPLPVAALPQDNPVRELLEAMAGNAADLQSAGNRLGDALREASGGDKLPYDRSQRLGDTLVADLTPLVRRVLAGLRTEPQRHHEAEQAWRESARSRALAVAEPLVTAVPARAFAGRSIAQGGREWTARLSSAEAQYRRAVRDILGADRDSPGGRARG